MELQDPYVRATVVVTVDSFPRDVLLQLSVCRRVRATTAWDQQGIQHTLVKIIATLTKKLIGKSDLRIIVCQEVLGKAPN